MSSLDEDWWPTEAAARVKLIVPNKYSNKTDDKLPKYYCCRLQYNAAQGLLQVVSSANENDDNDDDSERRTVLDVIDPDDMIGVKLEVQLMNTTATTTEDSNNNNSSNGDGDGSENDNGHGRRAPNEPPADTLRDRQGQAVLSLFCYPRRKDLSTSSRTSWAQRFGLYGMTTTSSSSYSSSSSSSTPARRPPNNNPNDTRRRPESSSSSSQQQQQWGNRVAHHRHLTLAPSEDLQDCSQLVTALKKLATTTFYDNRTTTSTLTPPTAAAAAAAATRQQQQQESQSSASTSNRTNNRRYLVVINPRSGPKRNGAALYEQTVRPMLEEQAGIECSVCITTHPKHAQERMRMMKKILPSETTTTTIQPTDSDDDDDDDDNNNNNNRDVSEYDGLVLMGGDGIIHEALNGILQRPDHATLLAKLCIGVVGCGTANGFATSLAYASHERYGPVDETFLICKQQTLWTDISKYQTTTSSQSYISFLTFSWGMIADIDIESERIHCLGEARFDIWAVWRTLCLRRYRGRFSFLPASKVLVDNNKSSSSSKPVVVNMPELSEPVPSDWETIEDDFVLFWASHVTHASMNTMQSPKSRLQDGVFQVLIVRGNVSRYRVARILLGLENGSHVGMPGAEFIECVAYRLEPLSPGSFNDIDGEPVEDGPIQAHVIPRAVQFFCNASSYG